RRSTAAPAHHGLSRAGRNGEVHGARGDRAPAFRTAESRKPARSRAGGGGGVDRPGFTRLLSSPRGAPRDSKSAFTRVCDALCVAGTPLRGPIFQRRWVLGPRFPRAARERTHKSY